MNDRELIVYATPTGALANACDSYFAAVESIGTTTAQRFPPHCTLTGFFGRSTSRGDEVVAEMGRRIRAAGPSPPGAITVAGPEAIDDWVGLIIESTWLVDLTASMVADQRIGDGEDALRPKDWLHLSLAYVVSDTVPYLDLARPIFGGGGAGLGASDPWEVAVWERHPNHSWTRLG